MRPRRRQWWEDHAGYPWRCVKAVTICRWFGHKLDERPSFDIIMRHCRRCLASDYVENPEW